MSRLNLSPRTGGCHHPRVPPALPWRSTLRRVSFVTVSSALMAMAKRSEGSTDRGVEPLALPARSFWLVAAALVVLIAAAVLTGNRPAPLMRGLSFTLLGLGSVFVGLPFLQLRRYGGAPPGGSYMAITTVAERGLYAIVRHPQYLGCDFLVWGIATSALQWGTILPAVVFTAALSRLTRAEEQRLLDRFGETYRSYMRTVPRFGLVTGLIRYLRRARHERQGTP